MELDNSADKNTVIIRGYRIRLNIATLLRLLLFCGSFSVVCFLQFNATNNTSKIFLFLVAIFIAVVAITFHTSTRVQFSNETIKVKYGFLPIVRKRKTKDLIKVYLEYPESNSSDAGNSFNYLVLAFDKSWNIKIMVDQLDRKEKEQITTKLSYLRYKFFNK